MRKLRFYEAFENAFMLEIEKYILDFLFKLLFSWKVASFFCLHELGSLISMKRVFEEKRSL